MTPVAAATREEKRQQCFLDGDGSNVTGDSSMRQRRATATVCRNRRWQQGSNSRDDRDSREGSKSNGSKGINAAKVLME